MGKLADIAASMRPRVRTIRVEPDMTAIVGAIMELTKQQKRSSDALAAIALHFTNVDIDFVPNPDDVDTKPLEKRRDDHEEWNDEMIAALEMLEDRGIPVDEELFERLGGRIGPKPVELEEDHVDAEEDPDIQVASRGSVLEDEQKSE